MVPPISVRAGRCSSRKPPCRVNRFILMVPSWAMRVTLLLWAYPNNLTQKPRCLSKPNHQLRTSFNTTLRTWTSYNLALHRPQQRWRSQILPVLRSRSNQRKRVWRWTTNPTIRRTFCSKCLSSNSSNNRKANDWVSFVADRKSVQLDNGHIWRKFIMQSSFLSI